MNDPLTTPPPDGPPLSEHDGEAFLAELDAALTNQRVSGPRAETAKFGAKLDATLTVAGDPNAEAQIRAALATPGKKKQRHQSTKPERRIGVLDMVAVAAIVALSVGAFSIWKNQTPSRPTGSVAADDNSKPPVNEVKPVREPSLEEKLDQRITFDFSKLSFEDAIAKCATLGKTTIIVDPKFTPEDTKNIVLSFQDLEVRHALTWICRNFGAEYSAVNEKIYVGSPANMSAVELQIYDVREMAQFPAALMVKVLHDHLLTAEFQNPVTSIAENNGQLVVMQRHAVHERILRILRRIRSKAGEHEIHFDALDDEPWQVALKSRLEKKISFEFENTSLADALARTQRQLGLTIVLDPQVAAQGPANINLHVTDMSGALALSWILRLVNLEFVLKDGVIYATDPPLLGPEFRMYNVPDLAKKAKAPNAATEDANIDPLMGMIYSHVGDHKWDLDRGERMESDSGYLLVWNTADVHEKIHQLLEQFRNPTPAIKVEPEDAPVRR